MPGEDQSSTITNSPRAQGPGTQGLHRRRRRIRVARVHEAAALALAAAALWSGGAQLAASDGWRLWALPLLVAAAVAGAGAALVWIGPPLSLRWRRAAVWGPLAIATPVALATMTKIDFSALAGCQLLLVAAWLAELPAKPRTVAFLWLVPAAVAIGLFLYQSTL